MNWLSKLFNNNQYKRTWQQREAEQYLSESIDLVDVERRQREIDRGVAPWQLKNNVNLTSLF
jgi:hypothetical protein